MLPQAGFSLRILLLIVICIGSICIGSSGRGYAQELPAHTGSGAATVKSPSKASPATGDHSNPKKDSMDQSGDLPFGSFESSRNRGPVNIQSQSLTMNYKDDTVLFHGNVYATQADGQLSSNTLNVKYGKDFHEVEEMTADGNVRISQGLRWCTSDHGVMNQAQHTVVLTGDPVCHDANDQISGTKITVHLDTGKSEVEGGVKAVIFPRDSKTRDNKAAPESNQQPAS
jgi:lipopolysaccharide transport protein LptA